MLNFKYFLEEEEKSGKLNLGSHPSGEHPEVDFPDADPSFIAINWLNQLENEFGKPPAGCQFKIETSPLSKYPYVVMKYKIKVFDTPCAKYVKEVFDKYKDISKWNYEAKNALMTTASPLGGEPPEETEEERISRNNRARSFIDDLLRKKDHGI